MPTLKVNQRSLVLISATFFCAMSFFCYAQGVDTIVEIPTAAHNSALVEIPTARQNTANSNSDTNVTLGGEYKSTKNVIEQEKPVLWAWYADVGYESEYNFRGTNLTPDADGAGFFNARVTKWNFTLGIFGIHQFGTASVPSWSIGEGGGAAGASFAQAAPGPKPSSQAFGPIPYTRFPTTTQTRFNEIDLFLSYKISLGPVDVTIGNIGFFIDRKATTFETDVLPPLFKGQNFVWFTPPTGTKFRTLGPDPTVEDEQFDRFYITLSTTKISRYITPQITYYQTVYSEGSQPTNDGTLFYTSTPIFVNGRNHGIPQNPRPFNERNEALGGYLEGRVNGSFPITRWADFNRIGRASCRERV